MSRSFAELVKECNVKGYRVLNLFQLGTAHWRCNMQRWTPEGTSEQVYTEFTEAKTAEEALEANMLNMEQNRTVTRKKGNHTPIGTGLTMEQEKRLDVALTRWGDALGVAPKVQRKV